MCCHRATPKKCEQFKLQLELEAWLVRKSIGISAQRSSILEKNWMSDILWKLCNNFTLPGIETQWTFCINISVNRICMFRRILYVSRYISFGSWEVSSLTSFLACKERSSLSPIYVIVKLLNSIFSAVISLVAWRGKFDMLLDFHVNFSFIYDNDD